MRVHDSFRTFFEADVAPLLRDEPNRRRLDGRTDNESNPSTFAQFRHVDRRWRIDADTHVAPLKLAYYATVAGTLRSPFNEEPNSKGKPCLVLARTLRRKLPEGAKHLYIYEELSSRRDSTA